jgi:hypothetical protein
VTTSNQEAANDTGLLARLVALSNLGSHNGAARAERVLPSQAPRYTEPPEEWSGWNASQDG